LKITEGQSGEAPLGLDLQVGSGGDDNNIVFIFSNNKIDNKVVFKYKQFRDMDKFDEEV